MFKIIQSHRTENLVNRLLVEYKSKNQPIFEPFIVIVPSMVLGDWLDKTIASSTGISTLVRTKFWGQYQWTLMQDVLSRHNEYLLSQDTAAKTLNVPEVAVLSPTVMQWRLFGYLTYYQQSIVNDDNHPLYPLLTSLIEAVQEGSKPDQAQQDARLWQLASDLARVFNRYLTHREDWLTLWSVNKRLDVEQLIAEKDSLSLRFDKYARATPDWLVDHFIELEAAQRHLWVKLFADVHLYRVALEKMFWQALKGIKAGERSQLPKVLRIFTIQQLPQTELDFLQRLSQYMDITLLHYNPSKLFWADIVDKSWLQRQQIINPESVFLRDYGHSLLSRLGKQSRDTFAMLANLSGNEDYQEAQVIWEDVFNNDINDNFNDVSDASYSEGETIAAAGQQDTRQQPSLLRKLQNDVLMLDEQATQQATAVKVSKDIADQIELDFESGLESDFETKTETETGFESQVDYYADEVLENKRYEIERSWAISSQDNSLSIHSCHSLQRQLEVLRIMIGRWLNEPIPTGTKQRHISDIVVLLPDVERHHALISSIFVSGKGQDGLTLPAKVTGVVDAEIRQLWEAITGFYKLLGSDSARFEAAEVLDWLMLPPLYASFGLIHEQMSRGCDLLIEAGFIRGFDELHLKQTLDIYDYDYRFTFAQALDRLTLGLVMPEAGLTDCLYPLAENEWPESALPEMSLPLSQISLNDAPIIEALCQIFLGLVARRHDHNEKLKAEKWLEQIETQVIHRYFGDVDQTRSMRAIYNAMNGFKSSLRANRHYRQYSSGDAAQKEVEHQLAGVEQLPLKLSFMLDSIEAELESQQVSAEPTGVITFGRFGALRNVPFDLVVMLNMNLSEFPNRDRDNRYDLMKATVARRGDRVSEDDDNGAFLDALLCARSACWIFYNGQSLTDTHEHLPANPVSELLQFLQGEVQWQVNSLDNLPKNIDSETPNLQRYLPNLIKQWLVTEHPALPFHNSLFETEQDEIQATDDSRQSGINQINDPLISDPLIDEPLINNNQSNHALNKSSAVINHSNINRANDDQDELDTLLNKAMRKTKLAQQKQFPPAPLWQAVFNTLKGRVANQQTPRVTLPTPAQYQAMAKLLGSELGQLGCVDHQVIQSLTELLNMDGIAIFKETKDVIAQMLFDIQEIDVEGVLVYQVRHPAKAFLRSQEIHIVQGQELMAQQEPLFLDSLSTYQLNEALINEALVNKLTIDTNAEQQTSILQNLLYQKIMPAGVARQTTLPNQQQKLWQKCIEFKAQLENNGFDIDNLIDDETVDNAQNTNYHLLLTPTKEEPVAITIKQLFDGVATKSDVANNNASLNEFLDLLPRRIKIKGRVPIVRNDDINTVSQQANNTDSNDDNANTSTNINTSTHVKSYAQQSPKFWLNILPNSASPKHLLNFWLSHLYWQVARRTTPQQVALNDGVSIWRFNKTSSQVDKYKATTAFQLNPIVFEQAAIELIKWALFGKLVGQVPIALLPDYALNYLAKVEDANNKETHYWPRRSDFSAWLYPGYNIDTVFDTCSQHAIWQYVLRDEDAFNALTSGLTTLAQPLYGALFKALIKLDN